MPGSDNNERSPLLSKPEGCCGGKGGAGCCRSATGSSSTNLSPTAGGAAVPLKRSGNTASEGVWPIERTSSRSSLRSQTRRQRVEDLLENDEPLVSKCGTAHTGGQCCTSLSCLR